MWVIKNEVLRKIMTQDLIKIILILYKNIQTNIDVLLLSYKLLLKLSWKHNLICYKNYLYLFIELYNVNLNIYYKLE